MALTKISTGGVKDDAVTAGKIPANAIGSSEIADNAVTATQIADGTITSTQLAANTIGTGRIADDAVTQAKIADDAIGQAQLAQNAVVADNLTFDCVTSGKIADGAVTEYRIGDNEVTEPKLKISNAGTNGQYLQKQSGNTGGLTWADVTIPPSGNTVDLVADGAIAAGKPVIITTAGKAKQVGISSQPLDRLDRNNGSESAQSSHGSTDDHYFERTKQNCVAYNAGNDTVFTLMRTSGHNSYNNQVVAYVYSSDSGNADNLTIQKIEAITAANQSNSGKMCVCALSSNRYFVAYYRSDLGGSNGVKCKIITVGSNGSTWSAGSEYDIGGAAGDSNFDYLTAVETTTNRVCIFASDKDENKPSLTIGDITSNNVWNCRRNELLSTSTSDNNYECEMHYDSTDDVLCVLWYTVSGSNIKFLPMRVASGTGAAVTKGTITTLSSANSDKNSLAFHSNSGNWVTAWRNSVGNFDIYYQVHSINSSTLAITSGTKISRSYGNAQYGLSLSVTAENRVVSTYANNNQQIHSEVFTISGTTITSAGAPQGVVSSFQDFDRHGSVYMSHNSRMAIFGTRGSNGLHYGTADTTANLTNSTSKNVIGFAPLAISDGNTGTINCDGNTVDNQSSLTAGTSYWVQNDGTLGTSVATTLAGGIALSSTKLLIKQYAVA